MPVIYDQHMSSADLPTPKFIPSAMLDSPMEEISEAIYSMDEAVHELPVEERPQTVAPAETMRPPPLPAHVLAQETKREVTSTSATGLSTSLEEAQRAMQVVMHYIEQQPNDFTLQESINVRTLMDKLKLHSRADS